MLGRMVAAEAPALMRREPGDSRAARSALEDYWCGPLLGEFGHKLMSAGIMRRWANEGHAVTVCDTESCRALYADFAAEFVPHDVVCEGEGIGPRNDQRDARLAARAFIPPGIIPRVVPEYHGKRAADFVRYGCLNREYLGAVVIHARNRRHVEARNWPVQNWHRLGRVLFAAGVGRIICIGTPAAAWPVEGALDMREAPLGEQMNVLRSAWFAVGPSSGPMHLASLCGCPHIVWCGGGHGEVMYTCKRYEQHWNPHKTPCAAHPYNSWRPTFETVRDWTLAFMEQMRGYQNRD